jgi:hypothetical protein
MEKAQWWPPLGFPGLRLWLTALTRVVRLNTNPTTLVEKEG